MLKAIELSKAYAGHTALAPLDLEIAAGEVFCLLGPNGAGKTTTLQLFLGFIQPSSGEARVGDTAVARDPIGARRQLAYVPEHVQLYPELSGAENLRYFAGLAGVRFPSRAAAGEHLLVAGLPREAVDRRAGGYSKGMRQKVAIALSRAKQARALLLDEPTTGLDPGAITDLCLAIRQESERGAAVLMVTHDLGAAASVAHRIGILREGQLVHVTDAARVSERELATLYRISQGTPERS